MRKIRLVKDKTARHFMQGIAVFTILFLLVISLSLFFKALPIMKEKNLWILLTSADWKPFKGDFGFLPFILSTFSVSVIAIIIALPLSLLTSIYLNSYASAKISTILRACDRPALRYTTGNLWGLGHPDNCSFDSKQNSSVVCGVLNRLYPFCRRSGTGSNDYSPPDQHNG